MTFNLVLLKSFLERKGFLQRRFSELKADEINLICEEVHKITTEYPSHTNVVFIVDIETTDVAAKRGCIVEVGIVSLNLETGSREILFDSICREDGFSEKDKDAWIFKNSYLTYEDVLEAPSLDELLPEIQKIIDSFTLGGTAYNNKFDFAWLESRGIVFKTKLACPMIAATPVLKLRGRGRGFKWPNVEEAWRYFFPNEPYIEKHRGADDAYHEALIVHEMYRRGQFKIER